MCECAPIHIYTEGLASTEIEMYAFGAPHRVTLLKGLNKYLPLNPSYHRGVCHRISQLDVNVFYAQIFRDILVVFREILQCLKSRCHGP